MSRIVDLLFTWTLLENGGQDLPDVCFPQRRCTNLLKGDTRASRANMTEQNYQRIFCSNMMKANQDIIKDGLTEQTVDIFTENSE